MHFSPMARVIVLILTGLLATVIGFTIYMTAFPFIKHKVMQQLVLTEGSQSYDFWKNIPIPIYLRFYFFNITNPMDVWQNISKPILEEIGPYTFRESREKVNITRNDTGTLSYRQIKRWIFQPDLTNGSLDDEIITINVPMMAAAAKAKKDDDFVTYMALDGFFAVAGSIWFIRQPIKKLLFEGYEDLLVTVAEKLLDFPFEKFGWFYGRNGTDDGEFTVYSGARDIHKLGIVDKWNGSSTLNKWHSTCDMINGSAGDLWPPRREKSGEISIFVTDICRSLSLSYLSETKFKGLKGYRYWADNILFDNGKSNPNNKCFCVEKCLPVGAQDVSTCKFGVPAVASYPHFLFANSTYRQGLIGLKPDPEKHMMFIDLEPEMGIPLNAAARLQVNVLLENIPGLLRFENVTGQTYYPVFWFSETAEMDDALAAKMKFVLNTVPLIVNAASFFFVCLGVLFIFAALILSLFYHNVKIKRNTLLCKNT